MSVCRLGPSTRRGINYYLGRRAAEGRDRHVSDGVQFVGHFASADASRVYGACTKHPASDEAGILF